MKILAVDDEKIALEGLESAIKNAAPGAEVYGFKRPEEALEFCSNNKCEVAFLDIEMRGSNGIETAENLKKTNPQINIIFTTGYDSYSIDAFRLHASGYIMKPVTDEKVAVELKNLRNPVEEEKSGLKVQCFGNFEVFYEGRPLKFSRSKTKELFAYLVDRRGASINTEQLCAILWEDKTDTPALRKQIRNLVCDLRSVLRTVDAEDVFITIRNSFSIDPEKIDCDFYRFCKGETEKVYSNEYMSQYSWAEMRVASVTADENDPVQEKDN
ncbi:MAG: response regulator [Porcipelethomonas sp.]